MNVLAPDWKGSKRLHITAGVHSAALTGYQYPVKVVIGSGVPGSYTHQTGITGSLMYVAKGECRDDFLDFRFYCGSAKYDFHRIAVTSGVQAEFNVEVQSDLTSDGVLDVLYGNFGALGAVDASSEADTYVDVVSGVVGGWKLEEETIGQTGIAADSSGYGNTGAATGTTAVNSPYAGKNARALNGISDRISIPFVNGLYNTDFTLAQVIYYPQPNNGQSWGKSSMIGYQSDGKFLCLIQQNNGDPPYNWINYLKNASNVNTQLDAFDALPTNSWCTLVSTYNKTTRVFTTYLNGVQVGQQTIPASYTSLFDTNPSANPLYKVFMLGGNNGGGESVTSRYAGITLLNSVLTGTQIGNSYSTFTVYPDVGLIPGKVLVRKYAATTNPTHGSWEPEQTYYPPPQHSLTARIKHQPYPKGLNRKQTEAVLEYVKVKLAVENS